jgi:3-methyladenine DNA glycosylase/8-oxoguanine DNA glycosylase
VNGNIFIEAPAEFSFRHTVYSHGWYDLPPFRLDQEIWKLVYVFRDDNGCEPFSAEISETDGRIKIKAKVPADGRAKLVRDVRHILRLDEDLSGFYGLIDPKSRLSWAVRSGAGRLLRSPTVFEDLVKTICTTNCSWALTRNMVTNLVEKLGDPASDGSRAFPTSETMASMPVSFYRDEIKAGYRAPYFVELAVKVADGSLDPESWLRSELPTPELKKEIKTVKGVGDYAAENLLKLIGRYDGLALDSWLRSQFYKKHNREKSCDDKKVERHYRKFGVWKGLAIWCDMTERWHPETDQPEN